ncbi:hypothetical protein Mapa_004499 [Marchantia paleacea]|nr:hypothetical protein Mapa_004499 [Marchantia paleacea]
MPHASTLRSQTISSNSCSVLGAKPITTTEQDNRPTHLVQGRKLDIVALDDVDVVDIQPLQAFVYAGSHTISREVESSSITSDLGGQHVLLSGNRKSFQALAQHRLGEGVAVVSAHRSEQARQSGGQTIKYPKCVERFMAMNEVRILSSMNLRPGVSKHEWKESVSDYGEQSKKLIPKRTASFTLAMASSSVTLLPNTLPRGDAPNPRQLTLSPVAPSSLNPRPTMSTSLPSHCD